MEKIIEIPEGYIARIEGNKVILEPKESEDKAFIELIKGILHFHHKNGIFDTTGIKYFGGRLVKDQEILAWLEKQGEQNLANSEKTCKDEQKPTWSDEDKVTRSCDFFI